jgi:Arc/MetJ-type ribon-helix-helix transcriptional regulator
MTYVLRRKFDLRTISLRLPEKILEEIDNLVALGMYANRTEALRDGARLLLRAQVGSLPGLPKETSKEEIWEEFIREKKIK